MEIIDNLNRNVKSALIDTIKRGSKLSVAAACFSIYAYQELRKQLEGNLLMRMKSWKAAKERIKMQQLYSENLIISAPVAQSTSSPKQTLF